MEVFSCEPLSLILTHSLTHTLSRLAHTHAHCLSVSSFECVCVCLFVRFPKEPYYTQKRAEKGPVNAHCAQEISEFLGLPKLKARMEDPYMSQYFSGLFPRDNPRNTRCWGNPVQRMLEEAYMIYM